MTDKIFKVQPKSMFGEFIFDKLKESDLTLKEFSEKIGITKQSINSHIKGKVHPNQSTLRIYSEFFGIPIGTMVDYIKNDYENDNMKRIIPVGSFGSFLYKACLEKDGTFIETSRNIGFPVQTIRKHCLMKMIPHYGTICIYARYFGVPVNRLTDMLENDRLEKENNHGR